MAIMARTHGAFTRKTNSRQPGKAREKNAPLTCSMNGDDEQIIRSESSKLSRSNGTNANQYWRKQHKSSMHFIEWILSRNESSRHQIWHTEIVICMLWILLKPDSFDDFIVNRHMFVNIIEIIFTNILFLDYLSVLYFTRETIALVYFGFGNIITWQA